MTAEDILDAAATETADSPDVPADAVAADGEGPARRLNQTVSISDAGPCKKHVMVVIDRQDIDARLDEKYTELVRSDETVIPGFRPGKAPRKIIEKKYEKQVAFEVKNELLYASLEQLAEEEKIAPLAPPDINPGKIVLPPSGPLVYEFDVEVMPEFELPPYKGIKLKKPVQTFSEHDILREKNRVLEPYGQVIPKPGDPPVVEVGDIIFADITTVHGERTLNTLTEVRVRVDPRLALRDGVAEKFGAAMTGAQVGDTREVEIKLADTAADTALRGQTIIGRFTVKDIKTIRLPELTPSLLEELGVNRPEHLDEAVRAILERKLEYLQRQSARSQIITLIGDEVIKELPQDLLLRQARRAMARKVMELQNAGLSEAEITARQRMLQQDILNNTALALKEHFVLQKIADVEKLDVNDDEIDDEIERIARRTDESPRKIRARLERDDMIDSLAAELLESKALDLILEHAEFEEVPLGDAPDTEPVATVEEQVVPGEMHDPTAAIEAADDAPAEGQS